MSDILGGIDLLFAIFLLLAMVTNQRLINFPQSHKIGLWLVALGMVYHALRNILPQYEYYDNVTVELSHWGVWIIVFSVGLKSWKNRKKAVSV